MVTRQPAGQCADWSSVSYRRGTPAPKVCGFRGSLVARTVGLHEVLTQKWPRQSHDEELVVVELVTELHPAGNGAKHLDIISIDCEHMVWMVGLGVEGVAFGIVEHGDGIQLAWRWCPQGTRVGRDGSGRIRVAADW